MLFENVYVNIIGSSTVIENSTLHAKLHQGGWKVYVDEIVNK